MNKVLVILLVAISATIQGQVICGEFNVGYNSFEERLDSFINHADLIIEASYTDALVINKNKPGKGIFEIKLHIYSILKGEIESPYFSFVIGEEKFISEAMSRLPEGSCTYGMNFNELMLSPPIIGQNCILFFKLIDDKFELIMDSPSIVINLNKNNQTEIDVSIYEDLEKTIVIDSGSSNYSYDSLFSLIRKN